ncbi:16S rRNA (cytosine(967)-C(5))-methyltransferase RsmB [Sporosarcina pasteurii]|uniref:16S rRNA (cytosine(967)-C(5))-methyltransferase n=1 Tax=Sporosarcina pasteurii TaxID=1474 RepID=A0A380BH90_SPOPA|nr:16S rRNA (cytosine(967)-C(5))-methyltransferase RsmB [Sporosarcina pasteurii]MDS9470534.1 16S rRNA (cytosine(967)-C(5))-methyltransferase RsmB [Sporosarcina pasteurii]QBQ05772.1 16S rRNA (cytosine(967)-C(5))-methyltransferase RsmB [Sporosarcina pasteurii]SUJ00610.1 Ribosomal RNA small subunit methyltransferase B [Sporosarcina pasteurii]
MTKRGNKIWNGNVRDAALSILMEINKNQAFSNLLLHRTIEKYEIQPKDRALLTELTYGTLQHRMTLDYYLEPFVRGKLDSWVRELLRMSLYQIIYLTKIPSHAVVHEAVEIAKRRGHKRIGPTVNGILRSVLRVGVRSLDEIKDPIERIAIETSHPQWLIERWIASFGEEATREMATQNNIPPNMSIRVNTVKTNVDAVVSELEAHNVQVRQGEIIAECLISESGNPGSTDVYKNGLITIQDESSMLPVYALDVAPNMKVLDMCAAPGGKTTHIAEKMNDQGEVYAHDLHEHKVKLIEKNSERLGLSSIKVQSGDSRNLLKLYDKESFDRILVDAPCSGFGVIRRKPEIKYHKNENDITGLLKIQSELLHTAEQLIKPNGMIVYSTCTVEYEENRGMVENFLKEHPTMELIPLPNLGEIEKLQMQENTLQVLPQHFGGDGFFVAALRKKG